MKKIFLQGLKLGLIVNLFSLIFALIYVFVVEQQLTKSLDKFLLPLRLGTIVSSDRIYSKHSTKQTISWSNISNQFSFFVVEYQLRTTYLSPAPRLFNWCQNQQCYAHRIGYNDIRKNQFNSFTIDDWWSNNKYYSIKNVSADELRLAQFLEDLPDGSLVVISEPFSIFFERRLLSF